MGILNRFFGPNIGAKLGTAIGIGPIAGQAVSEGLAGVDRAFGISEAVTQQIRNPQDVSAPNAQQNIDTPGIVGDFVVDAPQQMSGQFVRTAGLPAAGGAIIRSLSRNAANKVTAGGAVVVEILEELFLNNPTATKEEAATYVYRSLNRRPDGQLGRFTRVDQRRIKSLVKEIGLEAASANMKLDVDIVNELISKRFRTPPITISRSFDRKLNKYLRDIGKANDNVKKLVSAGKLTQARPPARKSTARSSTARRTTTVVN
jgi:ribosomal protein L18E